MIGASTSYASVVIVAHNELPYTRMCIESVSECTRYPYRLVLVDNGSTDGTEPYFRSVDGAVVVRNDTNLGFAGGVNAGLRVADGRYIVLLNNDTIVTEGWLTKLVEAAESERGVGIVGPLTNHAKGAQRVETGEFRDVGELAQHAQAVARRNAGQRQLTKDLAAFCILIKREVIERIGYFDERFGIGNFEDDDYCLRARRAGFTLLIVRDCFIYHFGERTFLGLGIEGERWLNLLEENRKLFEAKWRAADKRSDSRGAAASALIDQGWELLERGDGVQALRTFVQALREDPLNEMGHAGSAAALLKLGKKEKAYQSFERALRINPNLEEAAQRLTAIAAELGREEAAAAFLDEIRSK